MKKALITGVFGQDGSFLAEILAEKGYDILGIVRSPLSENALRIKEELQSKNVFVPTLDVSLENYDEVRKLIKSYRPDEIYHLAATHFSAEDADSNSESEGFVENIRNTANILDICYNYLKDVHVVTAGSCLMFDATQTSEQTEKTIFASKSYYGIAKITENMLVKMFRDKGLYACTAILYNHESHRRSDRFVTRKIVKNMVAISKGERDGFTLGSLETLKDWGYARDYAYGMYLMANQNQPSDYILSTGHLHSIEEFVAKCAMQLGIKDWKKHINIDEGIITRKNGVTLKGDSSLARTSMKWNHTLDFEGIIQEMIEYENIRN